MPLPRLAACLLPLALACAPAGAREAPVPRAPGLALAECRVTDTGGANPQDAAAAYAVEFGEKRVNLLVIRAPDGRAASVNLTPSPLLSTVAWTFTLHAPGARTQATFMQVWDLGDGRVGVERWDVVDMLGSRQEPPRYSFVGLECPSSRRTPPSPPPAPAPSPR